MYMDHSFFKLFVPNKDFKEKNGLQIEASKLEDLFENKFSNSKVNPNVDSYLEPY